MKTAIFIPSLNRPQRIRDTVANIRAVTRLPYEIYYMVSDEESKKILDELKVKYFSDTGGDTRYVTRMNHMYRHTSEPFMFMGSDDVVFHDGWLEEAMTVMNEGKSVVVVNDLYNGNGTQALIRRTYIGIHSGCVDTEDVLFYPGYQHNYADNEQFDTAKKRGVFAYCEKSIVEHFHWGRNVEGKLPRDDTYAFADSTGGIDAELYNRRKHLWA